MALKWSRCHKKVVCLKNREIVIFDVFMTSYFDTTKKWKVKTYFLLSFTGFFDISEKNNYSRVKMSKMCVFWRFPYSVIHPQIFFLKRFPPHHGTVLKKDFESKTHYSSFFIVFCLFFKQKMIYNFNSLILNKKILRSKLTTNCW